MASTSIPSPLNRIIATSRRVQSQQSKVRPAKVPYRDGDVDDNYYRQKNDQAAIATGAIRSPRAQSSGRFNDSRKQAQLQSILQKEKTKEKNERLQAVLVQRLTAKYGTKNLHLISFFVEEFLSTHDDLNSSELNILEKEVQNAIRAKNLDDQGSARGKNGDGNNDGAGANPNGGESKSGNEKKLSIEVPQRPPSGKEWQVIQVYQSILDEEKIKQEKEKSRLSKLAFRQSLDQHIQQSKSLSNQEKISEQQYLEYIQQDLQKHEEEEKLKKELQKKKHEEELKIRKAQIEDQQRRQLQEKLRLEQIDLYNLQIAQEKAKQEQEAMIQQKLLEKEKQKKIKLENEENKKLKLLEKQKEASIDFQLMSEYAAKLDRENAEREAIFAAKMKEMEIYAKKFENEGAGKIAKEEQIKFEQQLLREQQKKLQADLEYEQEKEKQRKLRTKLANEENARQLKLRNDLKLLEKQQDIMMKQYYREEEKKFQEKQNQLFQERKLKQNEYRHRLDEQVEEFSKVDINLTGITPIEKGLNSSTLKNIQANPEVLTKVLNRIKLDSPPKKREVQF